MNTENELYYKSLTPSERLNYLVTKYFHSQVEFAEKANLSTNLVNKYCNGKTAKIPTKNLIQIENSTGLSSDFILNGNGEEFVEGKSISPIRQMKVMPTIKINEKSKEIKLKRGESNWVTLDSVGSNVSISDAGTINIVDRAFDGLKNPTVVQAIENNFCNKYNIKVGTDIIIDEGNYEDGDVVLVKFKKKFYIAELSEGILTDYKDNTSIATGENTEIVGMIFKKIEKF